MHMEMKRINENTIRVLLNNEDLNERGITVLDLLNHNQQIEDFFYSILEEVDADHQFQDNDLVTFQVRPQQDGLELYITKTDPASLKKGTPAGQPPLDQDQKSWLAEIVRNRIQIIIKKIMCPQVMSQKLPLIIQTLKKTFVS